MLWALFVLSACATSPSAIDDGDWQCDEEADAAVALQQWSVALARHQDLLDADPSNCLCMYHMGYIWGRQGDPSQEVAWYQKAIGCGYHQDDELFFNLGMAHMDMDQLDQANAAFNRSIRINPRNAESHFGIALTAQSIGDSLTAEKALMQTIAIMPQHWDAHLLLAKLYLDQGALDAAQPHLETVLSHDPENEEAAELWLLLKDRQITSYER